MAVKLDDLIQEVKRQLEDRDYSLSYMTRAIMKWEGFRDWCSEEQRQDVNSELCNEYLDETVGTHLLPEGKAPHALTLEIRPIRLLASFLDFR